jgi:excinuclease ABC subunit C
LTSFVFEASRYPSKPGCYLMKDAKSRVIYVGKAKNLRRRLASYFQSHWKDRKTYWMVTHIAAIEVILVTSETESLVLENNLIKRYKPRYNRMLMDDESGYAYVVLTSEAIPRFLPYRKRRYNKALEGLDETDLEKSFGPYLGNRYRDAVLQFVTERYQIRTCNKLPNKVCLRYHMHKCSGICAGLVTAEEYAKAVGQASAFLNDQHSDVIQQMKTAMWAWAEKMEFERAQLIRDQVAVLESVLVNQIVEREVDYDQDVIYFGKSQVLVAEIKRGILRGMALYNLAAEDSSNFDACEHFLLERYTHASPAELITNRAGLEKLDGLGLKITLPEQGIEKALLDLCQLNYEYYISQSHLLDHSK